MTHRRGCPRRAVPDVSVNGPSRTIRCPTCGAATTTVPADRLGATQEARR